MYLLNYTLAIVVHMCIENNSFRGLMNLLGVHSVSCAVYLHSHGVYCFPR